MLPPPYARMRQAARPAADEGEQAGRPSEACSQRRRKPDGDVDQSFAQLGQVDDKFPVRTRMRAAHASQPLEETQYRQAARYAGGFLPFSDRFAEGIL
ncbi:hypothetical protein [Cohnella laeviribosi]|uniref:hypothetical protein n=1 Tax=Cohnella laeviribosi TaxID=380174 RepID=UPI0012EBBD90|nr:hypothetical protein [Cohnella laeviribosi]